MTEGHRIFPHGLPKELAPGLWQVRGSLPFPLPRNMTIFRLQNGGLLLHSVVAMDEAGMRALEGLGKPEVMVVPHPFHLMDAPFYKARYPELKVVAAEDARQRLEGKVAVDGRSEDILPGFRIRAQVAPGLKYSEIVLDLDIPGGRAIVFTDLFGTPAKGLMMKLLGPPGGTGVPRIVKFRQVIDREKVRAFLAKLGEATDLQLILMAHGAPIRSDCGEALKNAARRL